MEVNNHRSEVAMTGEPLLAAQVTPRGTETELTLVEAADGAREWITRQEKERRRAAENRQRYEGCLRIFSDNLELMAQAMVREVVENGNVYAFSKILDRLVGPVTQRLAVEQTTTKVVEFRVSRRELPPELLSMGTAAPPTPTPSLPLPEGE